MHSRSLRYAVLALPLLVTACADDSSAPVDDGAQTGTADGPGVECTPGTVQGCMCADGRVGEQTCFPGEVGPCECGGSPGTGDSSGGAESDSGGSSETGSPSSCGDMIVDEGEQCDDGDRDDTNECSNDCVAHCGMMWEATFLSIGGVGGVGLDADGNIVVVYTAAALESGVAIRDSYTTDGRALRSSESSVVFAAGNPRAAVGPDAYAVFGPMQEEDETEEAGRLYSFDSEGALNWRVDLDALVTFPGHHGVAFDGNGDVYVAAAIEVDKTDDDVWAAKYDGATGDPIWSSTFSGPAVGGFSLDTAGPLAVGPSGEIVVASLIRKSFNQHDVTGVAFGPDGGAAAWDTAVLTDNGTPQFHFNYSAAIGPSRSAKTGMAAVGNEVGTASSFRWTVGVFDGGALAHTVTADDVDAGTSDEFAFRPAIALTDDGLWVASAWQLTNDPGVSTIVARFDEKGAQQCAFRFGSGARSPDLAVGLPDGSLVVGGTDLVGGAWVGRFRP